MRPVLYHAGAGLRRSPVALMVVQGAKGDVAEAIEFNTDVLTVTHRP